MSQAAPSGKHPLVTKLAPYKGADNRKSAAQLVVSLLLFGASWAGTYFSLSVSYFLTIPMAVLTAGLLMRLFMIQHDCGHGSFFTSQKAANVVGFVIGVLTLTPYEYWRKTHAIHHAHSGDLDHRGFGDIETKTVREYLALSPGQRLGYRMYRHPLVLFGVGAAFHFIIKHRFPWDIPASWKQEWGSIWKTNIALAMIVALAWFTIGIKAFLLVQIPITLAACTMGVWLFYVQHQYEDTYWHEHTEWDYFDAGLHGSSHLDLPSPLQWMTASIGLHHIHHINARIPNYRLQKVFDENPELQGATRLTFWSSFRTIRLTLWDEDQRKLIRFKDLRRRQLPDQKKAA